MNQQHKPTDNIISYGKLTDVYQRIVDLEFEEIISPSTSSVTRALTRSTIFNESLLASDSVSLGIPIREFLIQLKELDLLFLYLDPRAQPSFFYNGEIYYTIEEYLKAHKIQMTDFRLRLFCLNGDILETLRTSKKRTNSLGDAGISYKGVNYRSIRLLADTLELPYNNLVKRLKLCSLPNTTKTVESVIEDLLIKNGLKPKE